MAFISVGERVVFGASEVAEDSFGGLPVSLAGVFEELREGRNGEGDIGASGDCSVHEAANRFTVGDFLHVRSLSVI